MNEKHAEVNQLTGGNADHVDSQDLLRVASEDQLHETLVADDLAPRRLRGSRSAYFVREALLATLFFGETDGRDFGNREDRHG